MNNLLRFVTVASNEKRENKAIEVERRLAPADGIKKDK